MQFIGIDAHKDTLAAAVIGEHGRQLGAETFANEPDGYRQLIEWATQFGASRIGIEGSGSLGRQAALALQEAGFTVVDVPPQLTALGRRHGRNQSKTDPIDALIIARIVLRDQELPAVRTSGRLEDLRLLVHYRRDMIAERTRLASRLHSDLEQLRPGYQRVVRRLTTVRQLDRASELIGELVSVHARIARQRIARLLALCAEIDQLTAELRSIVERRSGLPGELTHVKWHPATGVCLTNKVTLDAARANELVRVSSEVNDELSRQTRVVGPSRAAV